MRLTEQAHQELDKVLKTGDYVIDATLGNGFDSQYLARKVGKSGLVFSIDIQQCSIEQSTRLLSKNNLTEQIIFKHANHNEIQKIISPKYHGKIKAVTFNLGYLPGGNKKIITKPSSTLSALRQAFQFLSSNGIISLIAYRGHHGGLEEYKAIKEFISFEKWAFKEKASSENNKSPILFIISKN